MILTYLHPYLRMDTILIPYTALTYYLVSSLWILAVHLIWDISVLLHIFQTISWTVIVAAWIHLWKISRKWVLSPYPSRIWIAHQMKNHVTEQDIITSPSLVSAHPYRESLLSSICWPRQCHIWQYASHKSISHIHFTGKLFDTTSISKVHTVSK